MTDSYTVEELDEYRQVFAMFDTDGSGAIGVDELRAAMKSMNMYAGDQELHTLINEVSHIMHFAQVI
jgi:Ca2+-binding EF-hand superfamily protein